MISDNDCMLLYVNASESWLEQSLMIEWIKRTNDISKICVLMSWAFPQNGNKNVTHTNENEIHMKYNKTKQK